MDCRCCGILGFILDLKRCKPGGAKESCPSRESSGSRSKSLLPGALRNHAPRRRDARWAKGPACEAPPGLEGRQAARRAGGSVRLRSGAAASASPVPQRGS